MLENKLTTFEEPEEQEPLTDEQLDEQFAMYLYNKHQQRQARKMPVLVGLYPEVDTSDIVTPHVIPANLRG